MSEEVKKWLTYITEAIDHIHIHLNGQPDFTIYQQNITMQRAVERELEIIGGAINRILKTDSTITLSNARRIVDLRNRVIHAYDAVDNAIIWSVLIRHVPVLKQDVARLLSNQ